MACACKVNQEIDRIHRYYSANQKNADENNRKMSINKKDAIKTIFIYLLLLPLLPLVFLFLLGYGIFSKSKKISFKNFLSFIHKTRNGRK